ncbi:MAG: Na+/H+ antiporter NhaC family protein [Gammaproteobacteria bacterium]
MTARLLAAFSLTILALLATPSSALTIDAPKVALKGVAADIVLSEAAPGSAVTLTVDDKPRVQTADADGKVIFEGVVANTSITAQNSGSEAEPLRIISGWLSILPPLVAIFLALVLRSVIPALFVGIWIGAATLIGFSPSGLFQGLLNAFEHYVTAALADESHVHIVLFTFMIGGMVGIVSRSGGMAAIVHAVVKRAKTAISGQVAVWAMGLVIFFDDYSNTLVVGNTARPITDKLKISREKLAYIVDSTSAPVATVALITTWIGYQLGLIKESVDLLPNYNEAAYSIFLNSLSYAFYPFFALLFVLAVAVTGRDFGPMLRAERRARDGKVESVMTPGTVEAEGDDIEAKPGVKPRALIAIGPIFVLIGGLLVGLYATGKSEPGESLRDIIGNADSYKALMWASICGVLTAAALAMGYRALTVHETVDAWYRGVRAMLLAMIILVLAWALSNVTNDLNTAAYLVSKLQDTLPLALVPATIFIVSAITAFSTGTSWGTMGILMPLIIPLAWSIMTVNGAADPSGYHIIYSAVACNLAGAVWGDHCSPISDTTVLSSTATGCNHIEHVRTQIPYAMLVGVVAILLGTVPTGFGLPWWISMIGGMLVLLFLLRMLGTKVES